MNTSFALALSTLTFLGVVRVSAADAEPIDVDPFAIEELEQQTGAAQRAEEEAVRQEAQIAEQHERALEQTERGLREAERAIAQAMKNVDKQVKTLSKKVATWNPDADLQLAQAGGGGGFGGGGFGSNFEDAYHSTADAFNFVLSAPAKAAARPLIVAGPEADPNMFSDLQEDLAVMSRILKKAVEGRSGRGSDVVMGIAVSTMGGQWRPESIYLEGHGALFLVNVQFPLIAPVETTTDPMPEAEVDSEWEEAKQELFGQSGSQVKWLTRRMKPKAEYDPARVEDLKHDVLDALKSAKNVRHLKPDEWITVAISGSGGASAVEGGTVQFDTDRYSSSRGGTARYAFRTPGAPRAENSQMVIRVKKSDVDAFAVDTISTEEFASRAQFVTY